MSKFKTKPVETPEMEAEALAAASAALEGDDAISAALAATPAETVTTKSTPKAPKEPKAKKSATPKEPKAPRVSLSTHKASEVIRNTLGSRFAEFGALNAGDAALDAMTLTARMESTLASIDGLDKKTREKACNLFDFVANGGKLSIYTRLTLEGLVASGGRMTSKQVYEHLLATPYKEKTARRQASEMVALFPVVGIASKPERGVLELNGDSTLVAAIQARLAEVPVTA